MLSVFLRYSTVCLSFLVGQVPVPCPTAGNHPAQRRAVPRATAEGIPRRLKIAGDRPPHYGERDIALSVWRESVPRDGYALPINILHDGREKCQVMVQGGIGTGCPVGALCKRALGFSRQVAP